MKRVMKYARSAVMKVGSLGETVRDDVVEGTSILEVEGTSILEVGGITM